MCGIGGCEINRSCTGEVPDYTLSRADFIVSTAEAANSCLRGDIAAFGPGEFHRVFGRGSKILLPRRDCCLWSRRVSSGLRQRQQNPASEARLLPLVLVHFIGSTAEAAKSCFRGQFCCLWSRRVSSGLRRRQQNPASEARLLPLVLASFIGSSAEAAKSCF